MRSAAVLALVAGACRFGFDATPSDGNIDTGTANGDTRTDTPPTACGFDLCEGFENGLDTTLWTAEPMVTIDASQARSGASSIRAHVDMIPINTAYRARLTQTRTLTSTTGPIWVRAWLRMSALPAGTNALSVLLAMQPSGNQGVYVFTFSNEVDLYSEFTDTADIASTPVPVNTWFCFVWHIVRSTTNSGLMTLQSDVLPTLMVNTATDSTPAITNLSFGMNFDAPGVNVTQPAMDVWVDDIIVHTAPVSCTD